MPDAIASGIFLLNCGHICKFVRIKTFVMKARPIIAVAACSAIGSIATAKSEDKPNVIYLMFDDLGYGDLGCYGQKMIETPNIDNLASHGILFTDMYTAAPLSAPSRCCILTGKHTGHSQIRANEERLKPSMGIGWNEVFLNTDAQGQYPLAAGTPTISKMMQDAGYTTGMIGKWGLGFPGSESVPSKMGFDYFYGFNCQALAHSYYPTELWENDTVVKIDNDFVMQGEKLPSDLDSLAVESYSKYEGRYYSCDLMYDKIDRFVTDNASGPFFLMWTTTVPHSAVQAPLDEVMYYVGKLGDEAPIVDPGDYLPNRYPHATYAAMISHIDTQVGMLVAKLKELGIWDNTIFIVTSDNGPAHNGNSPMEYFQSGGPFRCCAGWGKSSLHEGGIRMPFVVAWGDRLEKTVTPHVAGFADLMPTLADIAGVQAPENDGLSFYPILKGRKAPEHKYLYWEFPGAKGWVAVRMGKWKGLVQKVRKGNTRMELYDLESDPQETKDLASEHPDIVRRMWKVVKKEHCTPDNGVEKFNLEITYPE